MLGQSIPELLELSNSVRQDDSDFESEQSKPSRILNVNSSQLNNESGNINLACLGDQG